MTEFQDYPQGSSGAAQPRRPAQRGPQSSHLGGQTRQEAYGGGHGQRRGGAHQEAVRVQDGHSGHNVHSAKGQELMRTTIITGVIALVLLVCVILPSEYNIDPTRVGRLLGLTEMGAIKVQLAAEAAADDAAAAAAAGQGGSAAALAALQAQLARVESKVDALMGGSAGGVPQAAVQQPVQQETPTNRVAQGFGQQQTVWAQQAAAPAAPNVVAAPAAPQVVAPQPVASEWRDEQSVTLSPTQGIEIKLRMQEGARAQFEWTANGSILNYDTHGDGGGQSISYEKGRGVPNQAGELTAAFTGNHGWFWRNRTNQDVVLTIRTKGDYISFKKI